MTGLRILDLRREKLLKDAGYALILVHQKTILAPFVFDLNRPALLEARQRAEGVLRGGLRAVD